MWRRYRRRAEVLKTSDLIRFVRLIPQRFPRRFAVPNVFMVNNASYFLPVYSYVKRRPTKQVSSCWYLQYIVAAIKSHSLISLSSFHVRSIMPDKQLVLFPRNRKLLCPAVEILPTVAKCRHCVVQIT